jgi:hypothetical protein
LENSLFAAVPESTFKLRDYGSVRKGIPQDRRRHLVLERFSDYIGPDQMSNARSGDIRKGRVFDEPFLADENCGFQCIQMNVLRTACSVWRYRLW